MIGESICREVRSGSAVSELMLSINPRCASGLGAAPMKPVRDIRGTTACRTREQVATALVPFDIDLVAAENLFAHNTNALVVERLPFSQPIGRTQNIQSLLGREVLLHFTCFIE